MTCILAPIEIDGLVQPLRDALYAWHLPRVAVVEAPHGRGLLFLQDGLTHSACSWEELELAQAHRAADELRLLLRIRLGRFLGLAPRIETEDEEDGA